MVNILSFGICTSMTNPMVTSATAANHGALSPVPCIPVAMGPWQPGSLNDLVNGVPALTMTSKCMCAYGSTLNILTPGQ